MTEAASLTTQGPDVVALGGGFGLSTTLRALRHYAGNITGIVSVADDGGSSGRLRRAFGIPAPGDLRRCLVALAEEGSPWADAFEHRFTASELEGHPLGNIVIAGLTETTKDFGSAIQLVLRLLGGVGRVLPATSEPVVLKGTWMRDRDGLSSMGEVHGEVRVGQTSGLTSLAFVPPDPMVPAEALEALRVAEQIVLSPGSLFTSLLAVASLPAIRDALRVAQGQRVYVANLAEQHPETTGFDVAAHVRTLRQHGVEVDVVVYDPDALPLGDLGDGDPGAVRCVAARLADGTGRLHDPRALATVLSALVA